MRRVLNSPCRSGRRRLQKMHWGARGWHTCGRAHSCSARCRATDLRRWQLMLGDNSSPGGTGGLHDSLPPFPCNLAPSTKLGCRMLWTSTIARRPVQTGIYRTWSTASSGVGWHRHRMDATRAPYRGCSRRCRRRHQRVCWRVGRDYTSDHAGCRRWMLSPGPVRELSDLLLDLYIGGAARP